MRTKKETMEKARYRRTRVECYVTYLSPSQIVLGASIMKRTTWKGEYRPKKGREPRRKVRRRETEDEEQETGGTLRDDGGDVDWGSSTTGLTHPLRARKGKIETEATGLSRTRREVYHSIMTLQFAEGQFTYMSGTYERHA
jgi:hypothetical protein